MRPGILLSALVACLYCVTSLMFNNNNPIIPHLLFALWTLLIVVTNGRKFVFIMSRQRFALFYIFLIYYFFASLFAFSVTTSVNRVIAMFELISPFIIYEIYSEYGNKARVLFVVSITIILLLNLKEMYFSAVGSLGLGLKLAADENGFLDTSYHQIYGLALLAGYLVYLIRIVNESEISKKKLYIVCLFLTIILTCIVVAISMYATALIMMILGIILGIVYKRKNWKKKSLLYLVFLLFFFLLFFPFVIDAVNTIIPDSKSLIGRFYEVQSILRGDAADDASSSVRFSLTLNSLMTFLENPIFGITHETGNIESILYVRVGNHAEWIDDLALYGIFAISLYTFLWRSAFVISKKSDTGALFAVFLALGFFNQCLFFIITLICFLYAPFLHDFFVDLKVSK